MVVPDVAVAEPVLVIPRSARRSTVVVAVAVLLSAFVSSAGTLATMIAVLTIAPWVAGAMCAPMPNVALAPGASAPTLHITTFGAVWVQPDDAPANVVATGSASGTVPPQDADGPLSVTLTV